MATSTETTGSQQQSLWQKLKALLSLGPIPYVLVTAYVVIVPYLAISNLLEDPRPSTYGDFLFVLLMGTFLVLNKATAVSIKYRAAIGAILLLFVMPYFGTLNQFYMDLMIQVGMFTVLALGLNIVVGFAGLLDLGYIAFYAVGAYLWAILSTRDQAIASASATNPLFLIDAAWWPLGEWWFFVFMPIALVVGAITGVLLGLPVLRLRGDYLAIVTLGFGEVIRVLATNLDRPLNITNGAQGIKSIGSPPLFLKPLFDLFGLEFQQAQMTQLHFYFLVLVVLGIMVLVVIRLVNSRIGRAWTAIREDETAALAMGVPLVRMKLLAFAVGASFAGVMGMIFAAKQTFINPPTFDVVRSISILSMVILGGMGSIPGAVLGAVLVTLLNFQLLPRLTTELQNFEEWVKTTISASTGQEIEFKLPDLSQYQRMIFGLLLIIMTIFRPQGILPEERRNRELQGEDEDQIPEEIEGEDDVPPTEPDSMHGDIEK
jgi:branched-chain amino acid transport system permease protein